MARSGLAACQQGPPGRDSRGSPVHNRKTELPSLLAEQQRTLEMVASAAGRCTLTATSWPVARTRARYTCGRVSGTGGRVSGAGGEPQASGGSQELRSRVGAGHAAPEPGDSIRKSVNVSEGRPTCARLAAAMGAALNSEKISSMGAPSSRSTEARASSVEKGSILSCQVGGVGGRAGASFEARCCVRPRGLARPQCGPLHAPLPTIANNQPGVLQLVFYSRLLSSHLQLGQLLHDGGRQHVGPNAQDLAQPAAVGG